MRMAYRAKSVRYAYMIGIEMLQGRDCGDIASFCWRTPRYDPSEYMLPRTGVWPTGCTVVLRNVVMAHGFPVVFSATA
jgi:hypothetical protein